MNTEISKETLDLIQEWVDVFTSDAFFDHLSQRNDKVNHDIREKNRKGKKE